MWNVTAVLHWRGRWIGRKDATAAGARGIPSFEARRILASRASELHGPKLTGFWRGVSEIRPEWAMATDLDTASVAAETKPQD